MKKTDNSAGKEEAVPGVRYLASAALLCTSPPTEQLRTRRCIETVQSSGQEQPFLFDLQSLPIWHFYGTLFATTDRHMLVNYFKIAFRNLIKNKLHSIINITGLGRNLPLRGQEDTIKPAISPTLLS